MLNIYVLQANLDEPVSVARVTIIMKYAEKYPSYPELWSHVVESIGDYSALDKRLYRAREKVVGKAPKNRNEFDPAAFFDTNENASDVIVLDSNNLPAGWKTEIEKKVTENESLRTREWGHINDTVREYEKSMDIFEQPVIGQFMICLLWMKKRMMLNNLIFQKEFWLSLLRSY